MRTSMRARWVGVLLAAGASTALLGAGPAVGQADGGPASVAPLTVQAIPEASGAESAVAGGGGVWRASAGTGAEVTGTSTAVIPDGTTAPGQEGAAAESVIGADGRVRITPTTSAPSNRIGQLEFTQGGGFICTGWLIDPNTIMMSGHCVHSGGPGGTATTAMTFAPARDRGTDPHGVCNVVQLFTTSQWLNSANQHHDWGMGHLDCNVGNTVGWFGYRNLAESALLNRPITVRGYPGDALVFGEMQSMDDQIRFLSSNDLSVHYRADTFGGQSGSPVYEASGCGGPCGLAVHSYGCPSGPPCPAPDNHNSGPRLTSSRVDSIYQTAAGNDDNPDALVRRLSGGFIGNGVINLSGVGQSLTDNNIPRGVTRKYVVRAENDGAIIDDFTVRGLGSSPHFGVTWFQGSTNITPEVRAGTFVLQDLAPGAHVDLRVEIKVKNSAPNNARVTATTIVTAATSPNYSDRVKTTVSR